MKAGISVYRPRTEYERMSYWLAVISGKPMIDFYGVVFNLSNS